MAGRARGAEFIDRVPIAAALVDASGAVVAMNQRLERLVGRTVGDPNPDKALDFVHPDDLDRVAAHLAGLIEGRYPDGVAIPVRVRDEQGGWLDTICTGLDLLEVDGFEGILTLIRTPSDGGFAGSGGWFEAVVSGSEDVVQVVDEHGRFVWASGPVSEIVGLAPESLVGRTIDELADPEEAALVHAWLEAVRARPGVARPVVGVAHRPDGATVHIEARATNLLHDPEVRGIVLRTRDVTDRARAETADRFASVVLARAPASIVTTDADGVITSWNPAAERLLGWPAADAIGRRFRDLSVFTDESFGAIIGSIEAVLRGESVELETTFVRRDGTVVPTYLVMSGMLDADGGFDGYLVFGLDLGAHVDSRSTLTDSEARWAAMSRSSRELMAVVEGDRTIRWAGAGFANLLGLDPATLPGRSLHELVHPDDHGQSGGVAAFDEQGGGTISRTYRVQHADGSWRVFELDMTDLRQEPSVGAFLVAGRDVTDRVRADRERAKREEQSRGLAALGHRALAGASVGDVLDEACELVARTLSLDHVEVGLFDGSRRHEVVAAIGATTGHPGRHEPAERRPWVAALGRRRAPLVVPDFDAPGAPPRPVAHLDAGIASGVLCPIDGREAPVGFLAALDVHPREFPEAERTFLESLANVLATAVERSRVSEEMQRRALHDDLTGLPNRTLLLDRLGQALQRLGRRGGRVGLLFVDLDRFKRVNDTMGHGAGDEVLIATAERLLAAVRTGDTVARTGGDEFLILTEELPETDDALQLADRVGAALAEPMAVDSHPVFVSASIGVAVTDVEVDADELVRDADLAMYRAKEAGRSRAQLFDETMRDEAMSRMALEVALRETVADGGIDVVFQPQVRLADGFPVGLEALSRWQHPRLGAVPPSSFVALAEEIGVLDDITRSVLRSACRTALAARALAPDLTVAVNLSPRQLSSEAVVDLIESVLAEQGLPAGALLIELTETTALDGMVAIATLHRLASAGFQLAIDDFGTGYSSMARLTRLPIDAVKIDRSFVTGVAQDQGCAAVVSATLSLAEVLGMDVVAEGVETEAQRRRLLVLGCEIGQGWLFGGPMAHDQVLDWLRAALPRSGSRRRRENR